MKEFLEVIGITICLWVAVIAMVYIAIPDEQTNWKLKYCELAEISPDFTPQEKADCRIMRSKAK